jgi:hypothetical protein
MFNTNYNHIDYFLKTNKNNKYFNCKMQINTNCDNRRPSLTSFSPFKNEIINDHISENSPIESVLNDSFSILNELEKEENGIIDELKRKNTELTIQCNALKAVKEQLEEINKAYHYKSTCYDRIINRQSLFKDRFMFCVSFLQTTGSYSCVYGSMVRKCFEMVLQLQNFESNNSIGDVLQSDINILFNYQNNPDKIKIASEFYDLLHVLDLTLLTSEKNNTNIDVPTFSSYKLKNINKLNFITSTKECIPRAKLYFIKGNDSICVDILCWRFKEIVDFSVNNFMLTNNGLQPFLEYSFLNYLENIYFQEAKYLFRPDLLQNLAFPTQTCLTRNEKSFHLVKMYNLISNRLLKLLPSDYKIIKHNPIHIEHIEECEITGCKAPYPYIYLECGHKLSIMAYKGILFQTNDTDTQSLRCPLCRHDLKIKFDNSLHGHTTKYTIQDINKLQKELNLQQTINDSKFISKEAIEHLEQITNL